MAAAAMTNQLGRHPAALLLAGIVALALVLRILWLRTDSTFQRTDEVMFLLNALQLSSLTARDLFWTLAFPWGYPVLLFILGVLSTYQSLGVPITEPTIVMPFAVLGALGSWLLYRVARRAFSRGVALTAALALAVLPSHIAQSRTVAAWILASDLMMLTVLLGWRYLERRRRSHAVAFAAALAIYLPSDNLAPGTLLLLVVIAFAWQSGTFVERALNTLRTLVRPAVIVLPALSLGVLVAVQTVFILHGRPTYGFLGHYLAGKVERGVHLGPVLAGLRENLGPALGMLVLVGCAWALGASWRRRGGVFLAWFLCFALPTTLLIDPAGTLVSGYLTPMLVPLLVLGAAGCLGGIDALARRMGRGIATTAGAAALVLLFGLALALVPSRIYARSFLFPARPIGLWGGEIYGNDGAKTAGYWIRRNTAPATLVLSDLRLFVGRYYFHRPTVGLDRFEALRDRVGVVAVTMASGARARAAGWLDGFGLAATVTHGGRPVFLIYARDAGPPVTLAAEALDARFDQEFGRIGALRYPRIWEDDVRAQAPCPCLALAHKL